MAVGPGIKAGVQNTSPIYLQDVMATSLEIAGAERPAHVQFQSLLPMLRENKKGGLAAVYGAYVDFQRAVTAGGHKLLLFPKVKKAQLFDMTSDPEEMKDLSKNKGSSAIMKKLFSKLLELQKEAGDTLDLKKTYPELL